MKKLKLILLPLLLIVSGCSSNKVNEVKEREYTTSSWYCEREDCLCDGCLSWNELEDSKKENYILVSEQKITLWERDHWVCHCHYQYMWEE